MQDLRKKKNLRAGELAALVISADESGQSLIKEFENKLKSATNMSEIIFGEVADGEKLNLDGMSFNLQVKL